MKIYDGMHRLQLKVYAVGMLVALLFMMMFIMVGVAYHDATNVLTDVLIAGCFVVMVYLAYRMGCVLRCERNQQKQARDMVQEDEEAGIKRGLED